MKKIYFSISLLMTSLTIQAQQTIGFEGVQLASESYFNGSFGTGGFIEDVALFENYYDQDYFYWSGFSVSNITDITTAGYSNQYSAFTGIGGDNSTNYAVYASTGKVIFNWSAQIPCNVVIIRLFILISISLLIAQTISSSYIIGCQALLSFNNHYIYALGSILLVVEL